VIAGRLASAFRNIGRDRIAEDIVKAMLAAGYAVRENDPFTAKPSLSRSAKHPLCEQHTVVVAEDAGAGY
jgi:hypothetical protein